MAWEQLSAIYESARLEREADDSVAPAACPNDGEPLEEGPNGELHCKFDGWIWDGQPIRYR